MGFCGWLVLLVAVPLGMLAVGWRFPAIDPGSIAMKHPSSLPSSVDGVGRPFEQTFDAQSEWFIVDVVQIYGEFMESRPFYDFDYTGVIISYWQRLNKATSSSFSTRGLLGTLSTSYFYMQLFMGFTLSCNFAILGAISVPIRLAIGGVEPDVIAVELLDTSSRESIVDPSKLVNQLKRSAFRPASIIENDACDCATVRVMKWPRYKGFIRTLKALTRANPSTIVTSVAGHNVVAVKFKIQSDMPHPGLIRILSNETNGADLSVSDENVCPQIEAPSSVPIQLLDEYCLEGQKFAIALVRVEHLTVLLRANEQNPAWILEHIFDF